MLPNNQRANNLANSGAGNPLAAGYGSGTSFDKNKLKNAV